MNEKEATKRRPLSDVDTPGDPLRAISVKHARSPAADEREERYADGFTSLLRNYAIRHMLGRASRTLDESDYDFAHRQLLEVHRPTLQDSLQRIGGIVVGFFAAAFFAFGLSFLTANPPNKLAGWLLVAASGCVATFGAVLQIVPMQWRRK